VPSSTDATRPVSGLHGAVVRDSFEGLRGVVRITLSNPAKFNAMSRSMWRSLQRAFEDIQSDTSVCCVVVQGDGAHFCAGGDISEYAAFRFQEDSLRDFHENDVWGALQALQDCDVPVIAHIDGNCMGAGIEIASCCDVRVASASARFGAPIAKLGFPMAPREAALVMGAVGELTAREMLLTAAVLSADVMQQRGFLNQVVDGAQLQSVVRSVAQATAALAPLAARLNKQSLKALARTSYAQAATHLIASAYRYADSEEHREGIAAFTEKRKPRFAR
jgi:enoyl-CoA hydratase/carnithine racemase